MHYNYSNIYNDAFGGIYMQIFVNQVGYKRDSKKVATVLNGGEYALCDMQGTELYSGSASHVGYDEASGDDTYIFDFSDVCQEGKYQIVNKNDESDKSDVFVINDNVYGQLHKDLIKCLYYQRCGCELKAEHAGIYTHPICHTGKAVLLEDYYDYIAGKRLDEIKEYDMQGGWHDAGDFGRYISPAAVTVGHLLYAFELFEDSFSQSLNIPESGNGIPDVLNEAKYEIDWMLKMQAPDGGAYHKLTAHNHADFIMPQEDHDKFIIFPVSSMATGDYCASMAVASRVYRKYDSVFADKCLEAARKSYEWLKNNDYVGFKNPEGSNTGEYDDVCDLDERMWAYAEMLRTDANGNVAEYKAMLEKLVYSDIPKTDFGWTDVSGFTLLSCLTDAQHRAGKDIEKALMQALYAEADRLVDIANLNGYETTMLPEDYVWGSNMVVANRSILLILAAILADRKDDYGISSNNGAEEYKICSEACLHYLLGRNALGRSYITGFGEHAYHNPHNRVTECDGIDDPMPGWVSGGPFKTPCDPDALSIIEPGTKPMKCHADVVGSYSTNEITIYWNSPVVFMTAYMLNS